MGLNLRFSGGEGDDRGWDGWMAPLTWWTWVWVNSGSWWWTGRPGVLWFMGSQRVGHDWATELNWNWRTIWPFLVRFKMLSCDIHLTWLTLSMMYKDVPPVLSATEKQFGKQLYATVGGRWMMVVHIGDYYCTVLSEWEHHIQQGLITQ